MDYDGSKTSFESSANYTLQEFANDVVYTIKTVCQEESVPEPNIITESGRVLVAYHAILITNIVDEIETVHGIKNITITDNEPQVVNELHDLYHDHERRRISWSITTMRSNTKKNCSRYSIWATSIWNIAPKAKCCSGKCVTKPINMPRWTGIINRKNLMTCANCFRRNICAIFRCFVLCRIIGR